ncbi:class I SAM-dependent methyltransferase [Kibdelosporangium aridum]|uniref:Ubiquinone/menaquinone biosynthesis C-methylase UbiE n=1 Tax=Kibdelosporangium aridum TaxID=2030 RepID=A0A1Y5X5P6_KIBAR|nr:class I SAM-dependent methyltransferase [Kibdelosporangium aridum]SMC66693.1 Ubiquinone/menaquinone biosynthesis C-methylase UbiE [Kibdelosporangium aridum]
MSSTQYDKTAEIYDDSLNVLTYAAHVEEPTYTAVIGDVRGLDVLDLGAGTGIWTRRIKQAGANRVVGLEISPPMVDTARAKETDEPLGVTYHVADATKGLADDLKGAFDVVTGINVLHYSSTRAELAGMCSTARDALRPGGRFIATCANWDMPDDPEYYVPFGVSCTVPANRQEGTRAEVATTMGGQRITLDFFLWRPETYADSLRAAGFREVRWHQWQVSPEGIDKFGAEYWQPFVDIPSIRLLEALA